MQTTSTLKKQQQRMVVIFNSFFSRSFVLFSHFLLSLSLLQKARQLLFDVSGDSLKGHSELRGRYGDGLLFFREVPRYRRRHQLTGVTTALHSGGDGYLLKGKETQRRGQKYERQSSELS